MLVSLLPGLRELRTPLAVGYLWLIWFWLLVGEPVPMKPEDAPTGSFHSIYLLGSVLGASVVLACISFVAYLFGTMLLFTIRWNVFSTKSSIPALKRLLGFTARLERKYLWSYESLVREVGRQLHDVIRAKLGGKQAESALLKLVEYDFESLIQDPTIPRETDERDYVDPALPPHVSGVFGERMDTVTRTVIQELNLVGIRLQAKNRDMWDTFDRSRAEAEFRSGIITPLILVVITFSIRAATMDKGTLWSLLWLFLLFVPWWLLVLATRKAIEATSTLIQAMSLIEATPPIFDRWDSLHPKDKSQNAPGPTVAPTA